MSPRTQDHGPVDIGYIELQAIDAIKTSNPSSDLPYPGGPSEDAEEPFLKAESSADQHLMVTLSQQASNGGSDDLETPIIRSSRQRRYRFKSWKIGVATAAVLTTAVLLINCVLTVWASLSFGLADGIGTVLVDKCEAASDWSFWLHIVINILSSAMLSGSNYTMQCVMSPTRAECDKAHARSDWLDIGIPSIRNFTRIGWQRRLLWAMLALSSLPIHFLYNSAVFRTLDHNSYSAIHARPDFLTSSSIAAVDVESEGVSQAQDAYLDNPDSFVRLSPEKCIETYAVPFLSGHAHVIMITEDATLETNSTLLDWYVRNVAHDGSVPHYGWICSTYNPDLCHTLASAKEKAKDWIRPLWRHDTSARVDYCLAQKAAPHCKLQFSVYILITVIICNAAKSFAMLWVLMRQRVVTFVTFGDAISSWLDDPDSATIDCCVSKTHRRSSTNNKPQRAALTSKYWRQGATLGRRFATTIFAFIAILVSGICFGRTLNHVSLYAPGESMDTLGFGKADSRMLLSFPLELNLAGSILLANLPQVILSLIYLSLNAILTAMHMAGEYSGYQVRHKPLRVTTPCGQQRATYWLQLPFRYGIPLIVTSGTLHWLVSQAVFLLRFETYRDGRPLVDYQGHSMAQSGVGLSPAPMLAVLVLSFCVVMTTVGMGFRKLKGRGMPVAGSCSFLLAAACHPPKGDVDAAVLPVKWGEVLEMRKGEVGHCSFTSQEVADVIHGRIYA